MAKQVAADVRMDFVQYHNPDKVGHRCSQPERFGIYTNKSWSLVASLPGNRVWLICGDGRPRSYSLCCVFDVDEIGECDHPSFRWQAGGTVGTLFQPVLRIDHDSWFWPFLRRQANFSLGLRQLDGFDVAHLERLSGLGDRQHHHSHSDEHNRLCRP
jgi:hypothetical protein